jgi:bis(5'-nucleosyl)-tetraphosphatase (symmetrical)
MAMYLIGDLQGCLGPLERLLTEVDFSPSRDTLYPLGDLVNRGPDSLGVLRLCMGWGDAVRPVLGNHDLSLLAVAAGLRRPHVNDTLQPILDAPDRPALLDWVRAQPLAREAGGWLLVHAGVLPQWSTSQTLALAGEVQAVLRGPEHLDFLAHMFGNLPRQWNEGLAGWERLRVIVNALTRLRFCTPEGAMEFAHSGPPSQAPAGHLPWFDVPGRHTQGQHMAFGHWSTLSLAQPGRRPVLHQATLGLDTGCLWGGRLSAARLGQAAGSFELISVPGEAAQHAPGISAA